jgi:hypothetical protein
MTPAEGMAFAQQHGLPEDTTDVFDYVQGWLRGYRLATAGIWQRSDEILPTVQQPQQAPITAQIEAPKVWATDNKTNGNKAVTKPLAPDSDVQRFYREKIVGAPESSSLTSTELYEEYCAWCEENNKEPFAHPTVTRKMGELGVKKERIGRRTRYFGIALKSAEERAQDGQQAARRPIRRASLASEASPMKDLAIRKCIGSPT